MGTEEEAMDRHGQYLLVKYNWLTKIMIMAR